MPGPSGVSGAPGASGTPGASGRLVAPTGLMVGADLSFLPQLEARGARFHDSAGTTDALTLLHRHGFGWVRLRLWHRPRDGHSGLEEVLAMARRARRDGLGVLLDLHYSDSWADPGTQTLPAAWANLSFEALEDSVHRYTREVVASLCAQHTPPEMVQLGNEIRGGMLWDHGRVGGAFDTRAQWRQFARLLKAGARGVRDGAGAHALAPRIMLHVEGGGDAEACRVFFDRIVAEQVPFDLIGVSYYPWWHGGLDRLKETLALLGPRYGRDVVVVETAYPWRLAPLDATHNLVGLPHQLLRGYEASPAGQAEFLRDLAEIVAAAPRGRGVFYWAPDWITAPGLGSAGENLALFDSTGLLLPAADTLGRRSAGR